MIVDAVVYHPDLCFKTKVLILETSCWASWLSPSPRVPPKIVLNQSELPGSNNWKMQEHKGLASSP